MLQFVLGPSGSGKTHWIYHNMAEKLKNNKKVLLIIPEHQVLLAEESFAAYCKDTPTLHLQILSFRRLANHVFRQLGGLSYRYIEPGAQLLVLWRAINTCAPYIQEYRNVSLTDLGLLQMLLEMISECKRCCVLPKDLEKAAKEVTEPNLKQKAQDFSLIYATYLSLLQTEYDDPADDLVRLEQMLLENDLFSDTDIYVDSFFGFSGVEQRILECLLRQSPHLTVALPFTQIQDHYAYDEMNDTKKGLTALAIKTKTKIEQDIILKDLPRFSNCAIAHLSQELWKSNQSVYQKPAENILCYSANNAFDEIEFVAQQIQKEIRNGVSYREIAVVTRGIERYDSIVESVFSTYEIPYFLSKKTELDSLSLVRFIKAFLSVVVHSFQVHDLLACLKSEFFCVDADDILLFEEYVTLWGITGDRFIDNRRWSMNPDGYTDELADDYAQRIERIHSVRTEIIAPFCKFKDLISQSKNIHQAILALYSILTQTFEIPKQLKESASRDTTLTWNTLLHCLEQLDRVCGDIPFQSARQLFELFSIAVSQAKLRNIPSNKDTVLVGDIAQLRLEGIKACFVIGANEDSFPKNINTQSFFSTQERKLLELCIQGLRDHSKIDIAREFYYTIYACAIPSQSLYLSYNMLDGVAPSAVFEQILNIFPSLSIQTNADLPLSSRVFSYQSALQEALTSEHSPCANAIRQLLANDEVYQAKRRQLEADFTKEQYTLAQDRSKHILLTQTKIEHFLACPFAYHCQHTLRLKEAQTSGFHANHTGNFVHRIFERSLQHIFSPEYDFPTHFPADDELKSMISTYVEEYIEAICGKEATASIRLQNLFRRLVRTTTLLLKNMLEEFSQSKFVPSFFELPISEKETETKAKSLDILLPDRSTVQIRGIIDRVDTYKRANTVYLRVVDYKTGKKSFKLDDVHKGLNLQMLIYLFSLWKKPPKLLKDKFKAEDGQTVEFLPAGVLYFSAKPPEVKNLVGFKNDQEILNAVTVERSGLLLDDESVLRAMEATLAGKYIPVTQGKKGNAIATLAKFGELYESVKETVADIVMDIKSGNAIPTPQNAGVGCQYCPYRSICRKKIKKKRS